MISVRGLVRDVFSLPARLRFRRSLQAQTWTVPQGSPVLHYGDVLGDGKLVAGGRVKLTHLQERWPQQNPFNILYLVSSAPPQFADELARWARQRGIRLVWNQNGVGFPAWARLKTMEVNHPMSRMYRQADYVVYQSQFCAKSAEHWLGRTFAPSRVLYNPVDTTAFRPAAVPPDLSQGWRLLVAGTHHQAFRVMGAIETARELMKAGHRVQLTIAGPMRWPDAETQVHATIDRYRLREQVTMRPAFTQAEAVQIYQDAHVLLHLKYADPCPTVAVEALACGIPVVASDSGGMPELIGGDGGELLHVSQDWWRTHYPPPSRIAAAVARIIRDLPQRSSAARARAVRLFEREAWVAAHAEIFAQMVAPS
jgi:glycosyltransferase involved in cell wall biosynthesis